ncbi:MAG: GtrA family protein [Pseudomonadota bacterium]
MVLAFARYHAPRILKFGGVGVVNVLVDIAVYSLAYWVLSGMGYGELRAAGPANGLGWFVAVTGSYFLNSYFTFRHEGERAPLKLRSYLRFIGAGLAGLATSTVVLLVSLAFLKEQGPAVLEPYNHMVAKVIAIGVAFWVNYAMSYLFVFRPLAKVADAEEAPAE